MLFSLQDLKGEGFKNGYTRVIVNNVLFYASGEAKMVDFWNIEAGHESQPPLPGGLLPGREMCE